MPSEVALQAAGRAHLDSFASVLLFLARETREGLRAIAASKNVITATVPPTSATLARVRLYQIGSFITVFAYTSTVARLLVTAEQAIACGLDRLAESKSRRLRKIESRGTCAIHGFCYNADDL